MLSQFFQIPNFFLIKPQNWDLLRSIEFRQVFKFFSLALDILYFPFVKIFYLIIINQQQQIMYYQSHLENNQLQLEQIKYTQVQLQTYPIKISQLLFQYSTNHKSANNLSNLLQSISVIFNFFKIFDKLFSQMGCGLSRKRPTGPFSAMELDLLEMLYQDLAKRSRINKLQKDTFLAFFHLNGLWGEQIFNRFDTNKSGNLDFSQFKTGIQTLIKGSYENKIHFLFVFYDIDKKNGVSYDSLLKMLYSYSKEQLVSIIDDQKFLCNMNDQERNYHFGNKKNIDPLRVVVQLQPSQSMQELPQIKPRKFSASFGVEAEFSINEPQTGVKKDLKPWNNSKPNQHSGGPCILKKKSCSMSFSNPYDSYKLKTSSNISLLVKKYAAFLFKQLGLDKDKDLLTQNQFQQLIKKHQRIFLFYYESFHNYIWEVDETNIPQFISNTSWVEGLCTIIQSKDGGKLNRYIKFYKTTIFVFRYKSDLVPCDIINMEGLIAEAIQTQEGFGFTIKHRDGLYPQNTYLFKTKTIQDQWLRNLGIFMKGSIYDSYTIYDKIGAGKYSVVYKGFQKKADVPVAVKVIEKFKFSLVEKEVIKMQVDILSLAHHPNIVTLVDKFQSKSTQYIITEFMQDGDLHDYVKSKSYLQQYQAAIIINDILHAISHLNHLGIIHRDLKCQNIMVKVDSQNKIVERAKIIDFGFAVYKSRINNLNQKGRLVGTPNFVAPQILLDLDFDQKVDMFSLGVIMFFTLTGQLPFDSIFMQEINKKTVNIQVDYNETHWNYISNGAKDLISKLLVKKEERLTVSEALRHPWIKNRNDLKERISKSRKSRFI